MANNSTPIENKPGKQMDDNIDDMGRKPDGSTLDQPGTGDDSSPDKTRPAPDGGRAPDKEDVVPGSDADADDEALGL